MDGASFFGGLTDLLKGVGDYALERERIKAQAGQVAISDDGSMYQPGQSSLPALSVSQNVMPLLLVGVLVVVVVVVIK
ncbi:hypothetical protein ACTSKR_09535 [Chitinibacteraceae bacterium HSL-7]